MWCNNGNPIDASTCPFNATEAAVRSDKEQNEEIDISIIKLDIKIKSLNNADDNKVRDNDKEKLP